MAPKQAAANIGKNKDGSSSLKQGSLFSFFAKAAASNNKKKKNNQKASAAAATTNKAQPQTTTTTTTKSNNDNNNNNNNIAQNVQVGTRVSVYWKNDDEYYTALVTQINLPQYHLEYEEDGMTEWLDLGQETFKILGSSKGQPARKRRRINDDDDDDDDDDEFSDEAEFNDDDDDESSAYEDNGAANKDDDDDNEDDDQWMVTDDEDDHEVASAAAVQKTTSAAPPKKKKKKTVITVTQHAASSASKRTPSTKTTTTTTATTATSLQQFGHMPKTVTPAATVVASIRSPTITNGTSPLQSQTSSSSSTMMTTTAATTPSATTPSATTTTTSTTTTTNNKPPAFVPGALNPAGSHVHNHLKFLQHPRDAAGRAPNHPNYDPRTLKVVSQDWIKVTGKAMTDAVQQWWDLKAQYYDTVLLFKTGKFYELFHMDADVGVTVCGLSYMKGHVAHAGFPEISYGPFADQLVQAGYKVARVEQTETPEQLKERKKKKTGRGSNSSNISTKVVNREVCSILTLGTRTFCYLDQDSSSGADGLIHNDKQQGSGSMVSGGGGGRPLLVIREVLLEAPSPPSPALDRSSSNDNDDEQAQAVCEYGITLVDAVRGAVTIGQFADDCLRSRMTTLLTAFCPCEILISETASPTLQSLIQTLQKQSPHPCRLEIIRTEESFPKSTALDANIRRQMERGPRVHPWDVQETLAEVHRRKYYPRASKKVQQQNQQQSVSRWPKVLRAAVEGNAELALSSFGAALFYLQRNLIDAELLSMGIVKAYIPPSSTTAAEKNVSSNAIQALAREESLEEAGITRDEAAPLISPTQQQQQLQQQVPPASAAAYSTTNSSQPTPMDLEEMSQTLNLEEQINHMALDGTTLHNLEILTNSVDFKIEGSLWSKINYTKTPPGARLLRAWLLRPLFRKADIERRADAVEELASGAAAVALSEATSVLAKCGDIERLLSRVHSMSGSAALGIGDNDGDDNNEGGPAGIHPNERAILYETGTYTKRKVGDFSRVLNGLRCATQIPEIFDGIEFRSGLLRKIVCHADKGGCFPDMIQELDWFFSNFDCDEAAKGLFEPSRGVDAAYDEACETIERIHSELDDYKNEMCSDVLTPRAFAKSSWKYANTKPESKDKFMIELPATVAVPEDFIMKGKRGSGHKQVNKYRTAVVDTLVVELERALDIQKERKARGMQLIFAKFDSMRNLWAAAAQATSLLDALSSLAHVASKAGYTRPTILNCPPDTSPSIKVTQGRHPCVEKTASASEFIPNDLSLGSMTENGPEPRVLLLSGPNMGGKSTLLRQTCLIAILAQMGSYVPAEACELTPIDRIYTRLGASDRILLGQSTFFVELAETAAALRGATRRSLCIFDELGRGTSTFDGTAIASAAVKHLVERSRCLSLFATHYHSLLDEWKENPSVRLGHMECVVENGNVTKRSGEESETNITFLYTLGSGTCPKSFGINVARLAGLPEDVLVNAKRISAEFEEEMNGDGSVRKTLTARTAPGLKKEVMASLERGDWEQLKALWEKLRES